MNRYIFLSPNATRNGIVERHWLREHERGAFGRAWADPKNNNFRDRDPGERRSIKHHPNTWHAGGDVGADILRRMIHEQEDGEAA